ncbi:pentatricopeptide repeat-containing protein At1g14470 [Macadamia integrifolia]|uniref:pentatricopeptide repeat-containing protein At1g14470 n=1 Tax=Macadamia integrifolia TaxID=60698 RepID=UPI001C4E7809|nr:pentatricopeptide repeat-containing protein At1g14470 [Macadamia integrifolia]
MSRLHTIASNGVGDFRQLRQLHAQIIHHFLHHHNYWIAALIAYCTRVRAPLAYGRLLFNSSRRPNVFVFTNMLKFYSQLGAHKDVISLFLQMQRHHCDDDNLDVKPDAFVYPILIKSAGKASLPLHAHVFKLGHACDRYVRNAIMDMYAKYGPIEFAQRLFDEMPERMAADWNSMVSGFWRWGHEVEACQLFDLMPEKNVISWTAMVSGYSKHGDMMKAQKFFEEMPEKTVVSWNAMLSGYVQNGFVEEALRLFRDMVDAGIQPDEITWVTIISSCSARGDPRLAESLVGSLDQRLIHLNVFVKTALLDMYAKCGSIGTARRIFDEMGTYRNPVSWNAMISAYTKNGDLVSARELFSEMPERNVVSWNSMIAGYAQNGHSFMAIELFKEMITIGDLKPDEVTMVSVISACGHLGALELGKWVVNFITQNQINLSISGYNSLISMYSRCGSMEDAKRIFQQMPERDVVSYNSLITGFAAHGHGTEVVKLFLNMKDEGIEPDRITFIGVLTACSHAGLSEQGLQIFYSIRSPEVDHYACIVDLLGRSGKLDKAKKLVDMMPMNPHAGVFGALLNASCIHKQVDLGEFAAHKLFKLEPENSGNYVLLSNIYASMGRWGDVENVRETMRTRGVKKSTGWSWVEFGGKVHRFIVGDRSHEWSRGIYRILEEVGKKMRAAGYVADKSCVLRDIEEEEKEEMVGTHSEKLAIGFGLLVFEIGATIRVVKNLRVCRDCHFAIKMISKLERREIIVRDNNRFHCFKDGECSCRDYW